MCQDVLDSVRVAYPRLYFVSDQVVLEGLALAADASCLPPALLEQCFQGLQSLEVATDDSRAMVSPQVGLHFGLDSCAVPGLGLCLVMVDMLLSAFTVTSGNLPQWSQWSGLHGTAPGDPQRDWCQW